MKGRRADALSSPREEGEKAEATPRAGEPDAGCGSEGL